MVIVHPIFIQNNLDVVNINTTNKSNVKRFTQNGQIQIYDPYIEVATHLSLETL